MRTLAKVKIFDTEIALEETGLQAKGDTGKPVVGREGCGQVYGEVVTLAAASLCFWQNPPPEITWVTLGIARNSVVSPQSF